MNDDLAPALPVTTASAPERSRTSALLNRSGLLATTGLLAATDPKFPRLAGD